MTMRVLAASMRAARAVLIAGPSPGQKSQPSRWSSTRVWPTSPAPVPAMVPLAHIASKSVRKAVAAAWLATVMMLFSWRVQASSVKLVEPVQTVALRATAVSRTTYLQCISWPPAAIGLISTAVPLKCSVSQSPVPMGAGSACSLVNVAATPSAGLPAS